VPADDLRSAIAATMQAVNPVLDLDIHPDLAASDFPVSVGVGAQVLPDLSAYLGWQGGRGELASTPVVESAHHPDAVFGPAAAAVLGSAALFRLAHGAEVEFVSFNPVELSAGAAAGTRDHVGPLDVGDVLVVGAGAVATALLYWARELGVVGDWDIVDGDLAELHNTNRCLTMTAADAGWPEGVPGASPVPKAVSAAEAIGGRADVAWYDTWWPAHQERHDLVLPLANDRGARSFVAQRGEPLLLHATTSSGWTAELHRHRPELDDCPSCRIPETAGPQLACATAPAVPETAGSSDAALPFLSAAAGLMLAAAIAELPRSAALAGDRNHWQLDLTLTGESLRNPLRHPPREGCRHVLPHRARLRGQQEDPRRWDMLDHDAAGSKT
jgi:hypothetical protein